MNKYLKLALTNNIILAMLIISQEFHMYSLEIVSIIVYWLTILGALLMFPIIMYGTTELRQAMVSNALNNSVNKYI